MGGLFMNRHFLIASILMMVVPWHSNADVIPWPSANFTIYFDSTITPDSNVELYNCESSSCENQKPFGFLHYATYDCSSETKSCHVRSRGGFAPFMKIRVALKNKIYESDLFVPGSTLELGLKNEKLIVREKSWLWKLFK